MLSDFDQPVDAEDRRIDSPELLPYLIDERIDGAHLYKGYIFLRLASGTVLTLISSGGTRPLMWKEELSDIQKRIQKRQPDVEEITAEMATLSEIETALSV